MKQEPITQRGQGKTRRDFLVKSGIIGAGLLVAGCSSLANFARGKEILAREKIGPTEDLMQEHGVLERVLLIYEECVRRIETHEVFSPETFSDATIVIRVFIQDYHEKQEEEDVFPRMQQAGKLVPLTQTLKAQHDAGRELVDEIQRYLRRAAFNDPKRRQELVSLLRNFVRMYRPHYAREDTVLFPAFRTLFAEKEFDALGEKFEAREEKTFGEGGFKKIVAQIALLEQALGLDNLEQYTPPA